jgi:hypothetical protein
MPPLQSLKFHGKGVFFKRRFKIKLDIFGPNAPEHYYLGVEQIQGLNFAAYGYHVPAAISRYQIKAG